MDNYNRLAFTNTRYITDYTYNENVLSNQEIIELIEEKRQAVIDELLVDGGDFPMYYDWYNWVPEKYLNQMYRHIITTPQFNYVKFWLDHPIDGYHWGVELLVAILQAYDFLGNRETIENPPADGILIPPKELSRTVGSQSVGDLSISFESERLSMKLSGSFEQLLSTVPNGIEIIEKYKDFTHVKTTNCAIV